MSQRKSGIYIGFLDYDLICDLNEVEVLEYEIKCLNNLIVDSE